MVVLYMAGELNFEKGDELVQLGDKNDRGPRTFEVFEYFRKLKLKYPSQVHMIMGNHELMLVAAAMAHQSSHFTEMAQSFWIDSNGGPKTLASYEAATGLKARASVHNMQTSATLFNMLEMTGHLKFLKEDHVLLMEDDKYIFCHAPQKKFLPKAFDWRNNVNALTWTNGPHNEHWVEPNLDNKIAVHGHIHGLSYKGRGKYHVKKVRRHGNTFLVDTGCGCAPVAPLSCLVLPEAVVFDSDGEVAYVPVDGEFVGEIKTEENLLHS